MEKKTGKKLLFLFFAMVFIVSIGNILYHRLQYRNMITDHKEAVRIASEPETADTDGEDAGEEVPEEQQAREASAFADIIPKAELPEKAHTLSEVSLEALRETNEEVLAWIEIPGTDISYPLMRGRDNEFYLSHNWKKEPNTGGSICLEVTNSPDLSDYNTILYGHRMRNGLMFGGLKYYSDAEYWREHPCIYLVADDGIYCYDIFASFEAEVAGPVYRLDIEEKCLEQEFLQYCIEQSVIETGIIPGEEDRILTLSTCTGNGYDKRLVVQGHLVRIYR